jgi:hypothetical protein
VPEIQSWLKDVVSSISMEDLDQKLTFEPLKFQIRNLQRVIVMREINSLYRYLPPNGMDNLVAFDPLPPLNEEESESLLTTGVNSIYQFLFGQ